MRIIKRYPNRKLYDTHEKKYIQLKGIADLIRAGVEVQVLEHSSGEDITSVLLTQVIADLERSESGSVPRGVLSGLIRAGSDRLSALQRNLLGQLGLWHLVDDEIRRRIQELVTAGELKEKEAHSLLDKLLSIAHPPAPSAPPAAPVPPVRVDEEAIQRVIERRQLPTRAMLNSVLGELDALIVQLDEISPDQSPKNPV